MNHERRGSGSPLVLLHGIGHRWQAWTPVLDRLAAVHDVYAVDLPGFGASPLPDPVPARMPEVVEYVTAELARLGLDRPHVAGNSLGGAIALELAAAGRVASATALSPAGFWRPWERRWAVGVLRVHRFGTRVPGLGGALRVPPMRFVGFGMIVARPGRLSAETARADALALRTGAGFTPVARAARAYSFTKQISVPVTVAWGTRDRILLPRQAMRARAVLPAARHVWLPGCGHVPMSDDPERVAGVILETTTPV